VENHTGHKIKALQDDKGGEYMSSVFGDFLAAAGIARQHTVRNEPHQNGVAERANCTLEEGATAMLQESHLPAFVLGPCGICLSPCAKQVTYCCIGWWNPLHTSVWKET
jgi:hypothetical protein